MRSTVAEISPLYILRSASSAAKSETFLLPGTPIALRFSPVALLPARWCAIDSPLLRRYGCVADARKYFLRRLRNDRRKIRDRRKDACGELPQLRRRPPTFRHFRVASPAIFLRRPGLFLIASLAPPLQTNGMFRRWCQRSSNNRRIFCYKTGYS